MSEADSNSRVCSLGSCDTKHYARGYCLKHWKRHQRYGSPHILKQLPNKPADASLTEVLWSRIDFVEAPDACWEWVGARLPRGYGKLVWNGRNLLAHRAAYEVLFGPIPTGYIVRHRCDNPPCLRPEHLELGTHADNNRDMVERGRHTPTIRFSPEVVADVISRFQAGENRQQIADSHGMSLTHVYQLATGSRRRQGGGCHAK